MAEIADNAANENTDNEEPVVMHLISSTSGRGDGGDNGNGHFPLPQSLVDMSQVLKGAQNHSIAAVQLTGNAGENTGTGITEFTCKYSPRIIEHALIWMRQHKDEHMASDEADRKYFRENGLPPWDKAFFDNIDMELLFELWVFADFLGILRLLSFISRAIATKLHGKTTEEMRELLGKYIDVVNYPKPDEPTEGVVTRGRANRSNNIE